MTLFGWVLAIVCIISILFSMACIWFVCPPITCLVINLLEIGFLWFTLWVA